MMMDHKEIMKIMINLIVKVTKVRVKRVTIYKILMLKVKITRNRRK